MKRNRVGLIAAAYTLFALGTAVAQQPAAQLATMPLYNRMFGSSRQVRLAVVSGRIANVGQLQAWNSNWQSPDGTLREQVEFRAGTGAMSLSYTRTIKEEKLYLELSTEGRFLARREGPLSDKLVPIQFDQSPGDPIVVTVGPEGKQQVYRAATFWHLALADRELCRRQLIPLLETFRQPWGLDAMATVVEAELLKAAGTAGLPDRKQWAALVAQLGDERFARREAADRQLRATGPALLGFLRQLDLRRLDAEQQFRVQRILDSMMRQTSDDAPKQVASWLSSDPAIWLVLLARPEEATRRTAAKQLAALLGETIEVDPAVDPARQKDQFERLRARIEAANSAERKEK